MVASIFIRKDGGKGKTGQIKTTHDGGGFGLVELLLKASDAERYAEKVDRVARPCQPSAKRY